MDKEFSTLKEVVDLGKHAPPPALKLEFWGGVCLSKPGTLFRVENSSSIFCSRPCHYCMNGASGHANTNSCISEPIFSIQISAITSCCRCWPWCRLVYIFSSEHDCIFGHEDHRGRAYPVCVPHKTCGYDALCKIASTFQLRDGFVAG